MGPSKPMMTIGASRSSGEAPCSAGAFSMRSFTELVRPPDGAEASLAPGALPYGQ